ncbi:MAG: Zn-dependent hydrolase [Bacteroidales bacterium]
MIKKGFLLTLTGLFMLLIGLKCTQKQDYSVQEKKEMDRQGNYPSEGSFHVREGIDIEKRLDNYVKVKLEADIGHLTDDEKEVLSLMFDAADIMEDLFWMQTLGPKEDFLSRIENEDARLYAEINYGPWDRLEGNKPFLEGFGKKPSGANFYPTDMTKAEFETVDNPDKSSLYTLIRRNEAGDIDVIWYHDVYHSKLQKAADLLRQASEKAENKGLKKYLELRAEALITDKYLESDMAWMDMKTSNLDLVIGPIENYEDKLFGYKAAFEAFVLIKDQEWSDRLTKFAGFLPDIQKGLPIPDEYKKDKIGSDADLNAYQVVYYRGDCNAGSKTIAINLPNDERVQQKKGSRKLQLKNAMRAKFDEILVPITEELIVEEQRKYITFDAFFQNVMFHEVAHGMGIKNTITGKGTVRKALKEQYSAIEEGKADIMGLYLVREIHDKGELEGDIKDNYVTFVASIFRSIRFGAASDHGKANMIRFNYLLDQGALIRTDNGQYRIDFEKLEEAMMSLMKTILIAQGDGNYEKAKTMVDENGVVREDLENDLMRLQEASIPIDIYFDQGKQNVGL